MLTADRLRDVLEYFPDTGDFVWRSQRGSRGIAGARAGTVGRAGYLQIQIDRTLYYAHRLAWLYVHGEWPAVEIDHRNRDPLDNRIANLREANRSQNEQNKRRRGDNSSGFKGVFRRPEGTYYAQIKRDGKTRCLGTFQTAYEAHLAYCRAAEELFGTFAFVT